MPEDREGKYTVDDLDAAPARIERTAEHQPNAESITQLNVELQNEKAELLEENQRLRASLQTLQKKRQAAEILNEPIEPYAKRAFRFMCVYSIVVGIFVTLAGFGVEIERIGAEQFSLPESVLNFLVGSTAATVIGLVGVVLTGIFVGARGKDD